MSKLIDLSRFLDAQKPDYETALAEIRNGRKITHWIWYIFPQLKGLGYSGNAQFYGIKDQEEADAYRAHPVLGTHLVEISDALLQLDTSNATEVMGSPDDLKLRSCMTLFSEVPGASPVFQKVLDKFFNGKKDEKTIDLLY
ncbi:MAG: DUF1810 domain-containing protein [Chitinophagaceae bacterium]|nr:MAG: DUF1810 domain-containing protein [Chitinophagaceae bacterium]